MGRTLDDIEGRYVFVAPEDGVSLADLGASMDPAPDYAVLEDGRLAPRIVVRPGYVEDFDAPGSVSGFGPSDMRTLSRMPSIAPGVEAPGAGISFADLVRLINPTADPAVWREDNGDALVGDIPHVPFTDLARGIDPAPVLATLDDSAPPYWNPDDISRGDGLRDARPGRDEGTPVRPTYRGAILPFSIDARGNKYLDWDAGIPGAIKRGLTLAGDVASGRVPMQTEDGRHNPEVVKRALEMGSLGGVGALRTAALRGNASKLSGEPAVQAARLPPTGPSIQKAAATGDAREHIYDFPNKPELALRDYYGLSPIKTDKAGRLLQTPEGYILKPDVPTVGFTTLTGKQEALSPEQIERLIVQITKSPPRVITDKRYESLFGYYDPDDKKIYYRGSLEPRIKTRILAHELGHAFHELTPEMLDTVFKSRHYNEYNKVYSRGRLGRDVDPPFGPHYFGYWFTKYPEEWTAELMRASLTNPNYAKVQAPHGSALVRSLVNNNPELSKYIQLNSATGLPALPLLGGWLQNRSDGNADR